MKKRTIPRIKRGNLQVTKKINTAMADYLTLKKEIEPFVKRRVRKEYSTIGHWMSYSEELIQ